MGSVQPILIESGMVSAIGQGSRTGIKTYDAAGALLLPGFVDAHIHLDKAMLLGRCPICEGNLKEAVRLTAVCKSQFTEEDVYARGSEVLDMAFRSGTRAMRTFVEVDPRVGMRSFDAIRRLAADWAHLIDLQICAFAQEGVTDETETLALLAKALEAGATVVGGCPYTDADPHAHVELIFDLAERFGVDVDFHVDFDLDPENSILPKIIAETDRRSYHGRVVVGHATKFAAFSADRRAGLAAGMRESGISLVVLPATDAFLNGDRSDPMRPRGLAPASDLAGAGVDVAIATNNVENFFTPFGDASLLRMAQFYANLEQLAADHSLDRVHAMISDIPARMTGLALPDLAIGAAADFILVKARSAAEAIRRNAPVTAVIRSGRMRLWAPVQPICRSL
ncbi:amidohydrolase family protein [Rhizobium sp. SSA_523]|uniref:amidohydrolase family protein n=2 Tax=Rhizobium sp. SSA_523 TaxID=2952477 RepID=UPI00265A1324|nr:amidohydrolase family protein [Rhizobium sp. SSA_523]WKC22549.1 amidohydrolase family protein [Rhizobium sp. SSA_523]